MQKLLEGVHRFQQREFGRYREVFRRLSREGQKPHTLFITCADSRVVAELITQSKPGDLFVIKNIGNIVPPAEADTGYNSTGAGIEFAVVGNWTAKAEYLYVDLGKLGCGAPVDNVTFTANIVRGGINYRF